MKVHATSFKNPTVIHWLNRTTRIILVSCIQPKTRLCRCFLVFHWLNLQQLNRINKFVSIINSDIMKEFLEISKIIHNTNLRTHLQRISMCVCEYIYLFFWVYMCICLYLCFYVCICHSYDANRISRKEFLAATSMKHTNNNYISHNGTSHYVTINLQLFLL